MPGSPVDRDFQAGDNARTADWRLRHGVSSSSFSSCRTRRVPPFFARLKQPVSRSSLPPATEQCAFSCSRPQRFSPSRGPHTHLPTRSSGQADATRCRRRDQQWSSDGAAGEAWRNNSAAVSCTGDRQWVVVATALTSPTPYPPPQRGSMIRPSILISADRHQRCETLPWRKRQMIVRAWYFAEPLANTLSRRRSCWIVVPSPFTSS